MRITFDTVKNERNIAERGLPFELVAELAWETAIAREDARDKLDQPFQLGSPRRWLL